MKTLEDVRRSLREALIPQYGEREAGAMAMRVMTELKGWKPEQLLANENREASEYIISRVGEVQEKLLRNVPLQYAMGETNFYGLKLKVGHGVLIPRPETEQLVDLIVKENKNPDLRVLDLCTGSGAIALALDRNLPFAKVEAVDISPEALNYARENAVNLRSGIEISQGDVFKLQPESHSYDIIVSNPPYVDDSEKSSMEPNVLDFEPHLALFVPDENPLLFYKRIAEIGTESLKKGGRIYFEINPRHAADLKKMLENKGYDEVTLIKDVHGNYRFASAILS